MPGVDMDDLACVVVGVAPEKLVAPGLVSSCGHGGMLRRCAREAGNCGAWRVASGFGASADLPTIGATL